MKPFIHQQDVSRETLLFARELYSRNREVLEAYQSELLWWNKRVNLVSRDVSLETLQEHIVHSLLPAAMSLLQGAEFWIDAGTGGGLPGIPLAIIEHDKNWLLNDIVKKKIMAVRQILNRLELRNTTGEATSIDKIKWNPGSGIVTKHAFSVPVLLRLIEGRTWRKIVFFKGVSEAMNEIGREDLHVGGTLFSFQFGEQEVFYKGKGILLLEPEVDPGS